MKSREEINAKISASLKGRKVGGSFKSGSEWNGRSFTDDDRRKGNEAYRSNCDSRLWADWDALKFPSKKKRVVLEQNKKCLRCGIDSWNNEKIVLEIDHIDGDRTNNTRSNLRALCPNCHSQTPTWKRIKSALSGSSP